MCVVIKEVIRRDLLNNAELSELFLEFDDEPLGSARFLARIHLHIFIFIMTIITCVWLSSIAQVHKAKLLDGRIVAVKVKRPGIEGKLLGDIQAIYIHAYIQNNPITVYTYRSYVYITIYVLRI